MRRPAVYKQYVMAYAAGNWRKSYFLAAFVLTETAAEVSSEYLVRSSASCVHCHTTGSRPAKASKRSAVGGRSRPAAACRLASARVCISLCLSYNSLQLNSTWGCAMKAAAAAAAAAG